MHSLFDYCKTNDVVIYFEYNPYENTDMLTIKHKDGRFKRLSIRDDDLLELSKCSDEYREEWLVNSIDDLLNFEEAK